MDFPIIETDRLILSQIKYDDLPQIYKGLSDPMVIEYYGVSYQSLEETKDQMKWFKDLEVNDNGIWWAIRVKDRGEFCGAGGFNDWNKNYRKAEIGFWLYPEFWGKGYLKEAMSEMMNYGFNEMNLHRIEGFVDAKNEKCKRAIHKIGMTYEGTMKDCEIKGNDFVSIEIYRKLSIK